MPEVIDALSGLLTHGDAADRCYACQALGVIGDPRATSALADRLRDEDVDVCVDAAEALGRIGDPRVVERLLDSLRNDPDAEVQTAVVEALAHLDGDSVTEVLVEIAAGRPDHMMVDAGDSWDAWWDMQLEAVRALGRMRDARAVAVLAGILDDDQGQDIDNEVLKALALIGGEGERVLRQRLQRGAARERRRTAEALAHAGTASAVEAIAGALQDDSAQVRSAALEALAKAGASGHMGAVLTLFKDRDAAVRRAAIEAAKVLAGTGATADGALGELLPLLDDGDAEVRQAVLKSLASDAVRLSARDCRQVAALLDDSEAGVVSAACETLATCAGAESCADLLAVLERAGAEPMARAAAARALGRLGIWDARVEQGLVGSVNDASPPLRAAALDSLADLALKDGNGYDAGQTAAGETHAALDHLVSALQGTLVVSTPADAPGSRVFDEIPVHTQTSPASDDQTAELAEVVTPALPSPLPEQTARGATSTMQAIMMANAEMMLQQSIATAEDQSDSADMGDELSEYLEIVRQNDAAGEWMLSRDTRPVAEDVRQLAARVLARLPCARTANALVAVLDDQDLGVRRAACASLARVIDSGAPPIDRDAAIEALLRQTHSEDRDLRAAGLLALAALAAGAAMPRVAECLEDPVAGVRIRAIDALAAIGISEKDISAAQRLTTKLGDPEPGVRTAATRALGALLGEIPASERPAVRAELIEHLVQAAFAGDGGQSREVARALRAVDTGATTPRLLALLGELPSSAERRIVINMLEEVHRPQVSRQAKALHAGDI